MHLVHAQNNDNTWYTNGYKSICLIRGVLKLKELDSHANYMS